MVAATGQRLPRFHALIDETLASLICQTPIAQRLSDLHEPVTIPAIHPVTPCLTSGIKTYQAFLRMMRATIPLSTHYSVLLCLRCTVCPSRALVSSLHRWDRRL